VLAVPVDEPRGSPIVVRKPHRPAVDVHVRLEVREPVGKRQGWVAQRVGERVSQVGRRGFASQFDHQVAHR
jgi:hypothetical protein